MAIIGLSGYIGAGKDTVGSIIQWLIEYPNTEDRTDGKNNRSYNSFIMDLGMGHEPLWEIKKFAGKLKEIASLLTGIPVWKFEDQEFKKTFLGEEWYYGAMRMSVREFLQRLGTEAIRDGLHQNAWVNALFADYNNIYVTGVYARSDTFIKHEGPYPNWIITDVRFPNEAQAIKDRGGIIVRINRFQKHHTSVGLHPSETSLDDWKFDEVINNNGTIDELMKKVKDILIVRNLL